jgi:hypothetical protein
MKTLRPQPSLSAAVAIGAAIVVLCFAAQDLWEYHRAVAQRWTAWAVSGQALWQLAGGIGKLVATVSLLIAGGRLLRRKFARSAPGIPQA